MARSGPGWSSVASSSRCALGIFAHELPFLGFIHGFWALLLFCACLPRVPSRLTWSPRCGLRRRPQPRDHSRPGPGPGRDRPHPGDRRAAGRDVVEQPPAVVVLRHGHGGDGLRRRPARRRTTTARCTWPPGSVSVRDLDTPKGRKADVVVDLDVRQGTVKLADGRKVEGYTVNGTSPGPADRGDRGPAGRGPRPQRQRRRGHRHPLARCRRAQRRGRRRRGHPGRDQAGRGLHLPLGRPARRHLLVPLPPGLPRAGRRRPARRHPDPPARHPTPGVQGRHRRGAPLRRQGDRQRSRRVPARRGRARAAGAGAGGQHRQRPAGRCGRARRTGSWPPTGTT